MQHGLALRRAPELYRNDRAGRPGAAWLQWIYGLILGGALLMAHSTVRLGLPPALNQDVAGA